MADSSDDLGIPMKPARPVPPPPAAAPRPSSAPPPRPAELTRIGDSPRGTEALRRSEPRRGDGESRKLIVGPEITLAGEITACDMLIVEGSVEANLTNCRDISIAESGLFKGSAAIEEAEIRGRFEGDLTVRRRLLIRASGRVSGTIRYGQLEIECGGQISGDIQAQPAAEHGDIAAPAIARAAG